MVLNRYVTKQKELSPANTKNKQTNRDCMQREYYARSQDVQERYYIIGLSFCGLLLLLTVFLYASDSANPSNWYFFITLFTVFCLTSTFSSFVARDVYLDEATPFYIAFIWGFNILVVVFVIVMSLAVVYPGAPTSFFLEQSGLGANLEKVVGISIFVEFIIDGFAYIIYAWKTQNNNLVWVFLFLEFTLLVLALVPSIEVFSLDAILLAGVLSCAHVIQSFID